MLSPKAEFDWSKTLAATKGELVLRTATALLMSAAASLVLVGASAWAALPLNDLDLFVFLH